MREPGPSSNVRAINFFFANSPFCCCFASKRLLSSFICACKASLSALAFSSSFCRRSISSLSALTSDCSSCFSSSDIRASCCAFLSLSSCAARLAPVSESAKPVSASTRHTTSAIIVTVSEVLLRLRRVCRSYCPYPISFIPPKQNTSFNN